MYIFSIDPSKRPLLTFIIYFQLGVKLGRYGLLQLGILRENVMAKHFMYEHF